MKKSGAKTSHRPDKRPPPLALPNPNYMKSTTSADARRERSKVTSNIPQTSHDNSSLHIKGSTNSPNIRLNLRPETALTRNGHTVCSYGYCSCNGHLRAVLPPLKCFVSRRRRALADKIRPNGGRPNPVERIGRDEPPTSQISLSNEDATTEKLRDQAFNTTTFIAGIECKEGIRPDKGLKSRNAATVKRNEGNSRRLINRRGPKILPLEAEPGAEEVNLRHQELDSRKNPEEWMVDYAMREAVKKCTAPTNTKVALLVQAFETVLPNSQI